MAATPNDLNLDDPELKKAIEDSMFPDELCIVLALSELEEVEKTAMPDGLESKQVNENEELQLAIALSASTAEEENQKLIEQQQIQRLVALEAEEKANQELLAQEALRNAQKEADEAATQLFLMNERVLEEERLKQLNDDQRIAEQLAGLEHKDSVEEVSIALPFDHIPIAQKLKFLEELELIIHSPAVAGEYSKKEGEGLPVAELTDAHKFTSTLIRAGIPTLRAIDDALRSNELKPHMLPEAVLTEILAAIQHDPSFYSAHAANITTSVNNVISAAAANPIDLAETHAQVPELLSRTWTLAKQLGRDFTAAVAAALSDNIVDQGGCIPGLVARVYPIYAKMIQYTLEESLKPIPNLRMHF